MRFLRGVLCGLLVLSGYLQAAHAPLTVTVATPKYVARTFLRWQQKEPCQQVKHYSSPYANRGTVELIIICRALYEAGLNFSLDLLEAPNYSRALLDVKSGRAMISAETVWDQEITEEFHVSKLIIPSKKFVKGIYVRSGDNRLNNVRSIDDLRKFRGVMVKNWIIDWYTMENMNLTMFPVNSIESLYYMIESERADYTLFEFNQAVHQARRVKHIQLQIIPGIKIRLDGERFFVVSKKAKYDDLVFSFLQQGLDVLQKNGEIHRAYRESGFFNPVMDDWILLNP
ncbi:hypothetical protein [Zooshikella harenae]|uniref:Solute-binding protein family 3/N-terminal domain-containing protein n=1 Tax=Zooshikella harenae TaxID=2827238 RepID=A0ABS5ZGQ0_9GAMM|nr:hypothetical protein [Zooshikella harenae]MBU2713222.1 hypothetical protein [Zooshikella harenae]